MVGLGKGGWMEGIGIKETNTQFNKWIRVEPCPDLCTMKGTVSLTQPSPPEGQPDK